MFSKEKPYIIAEVGQNHQGDINQALDYVKTFSSLGADAVKFQMRKNKYLFHSEMYKKSYLSNNSFGSSYGEHREQLELTFEEMKTVRDMCSECDVDFIATPFDEPSLSELEMLNPKAIKIASFDLGNIPFLNLISQLNKPVVMSTGGSNLDQIDASVDCMGLEKNQLAILHCVSKYPCPYNELLLNRITILSQRYPNYTIGCSDHYNGILSGPIAYMLGARVFEKHVTFDRASKGTDHSFSLEREGFRKFVRDINRLPQMLQQDLPEDLGQEPVFQKLGKSLIAKNFIAKGTVITAKDLSGRIFTQTGIPVRQSFRIIDTIAERDFNPGDKIVFDNKI